MRKTRKNLVLMFFALAFIAYSQGQSITITSPSDGDTVGTSFDVTADAVGTYNKVRIKLDGVTQTELDDTSAPYSFALSGVSEGSHELKVYGKDTPSGTWHNQVINVNVVSSTAVTGVSISPTTTSVAIGETTSLIETVSPSDATDKSVSWSSSNSLVATVNSSGTVSAVSVGTAIITVSTNDGNFTDTSNITVTGGGSSGDPSVTITSPSDGATVGASFEVTADAVGTYTRLRIKVDDVLQSDLDDTTAPYSFALAGLSAGTHSIKVYGKDTESGTWKNQIINVIVNTNTGGGGGDIGGSCPSCPIRVGDAGVTFASGGNAQTAEWIKAGVEGGIPYLSTTTVASTISATNTAGIQQAIDAASAAGGGQVVLNDGTYTIDATLKMKNNVRIAGQSQDGVILNITMTGTSGSAIEFGTYGVQNAGIDNLTIQGGQGQPNDFNMTDAKPNFLIHSVYISGGAKNCWLDKVKIINSGNGGITTWNCSNITIRDCYIERSWNKGGGGHGYVQLSGSYILFFNNTVKKMRHLAIQREGAHHNVVYRNNLEQDVNFHNADAGDNLVEKNVIRLPAGLGNEWHAVMGIWSVQHNDPGPNNVVWGNDGIEYNNGGISSFCDASKVWVPVGDERDPGGAFTTNTNIPTGGSFYPVNNVPENDGATPRTECSNGGTPPSGNCGEDSGPGSIFNDNFECADWGSKYELVPAGDANVNSNEVEHLPTGGFNGTGGIRITIKNGGFYGADFKKQIGNLQEAYAQYKVFYESDFTDFYGKSPGWDGTRNVCGWGNCTYPISGQNGWSARGSLDKINGKVKNKYYVYHTELPAEQEFGDSWYWEGPAATMNTGQWYTIDQYIKVNTPGQNDGILRAWNNGALIFEKTDIRFTNAGGEFATVDKYWINFYHGGKDTSPKEQHLRLDDLRISANPIGSSPTGNGCLGSHCTSFANLTNPSNGANLTFPFNVTGSVSPGYRMSVVMLNSNGETQQDKVWVGGTTGTNNSGTFECTEKPNVLTGATKLEFYGVDDDGNGDGFKYFTEKIIIDVNLAGGSGDGTNPPPTTETATEGGITIIYPTNSGSSFEVSATSTTNFDSWSIKVDNVWVASSGAGTTANFSLSGIANGTHEIFVYAKSGTVWTDGPKVNLTVGTTSKSTKNKNTLDYHDLDKNQEDAKLYPNPAMDYLNLLLGSNHSYYKLEIIDINGRALIVKSLRLTDYKVEIDLNKINISSGVYFLNLVSDKDRKVIKFVKN
ncbi:Ig-like domain-containing protein [Algibacter mikhailovii]|uniref:BIG2 domain-containing protein n=1 Tax=Algibacter mikhailovii TaxID=425498 RepID=A0A918QT02_9FLAO|nr:Ig-like domain-containing protein [Algibacter mikhailovii]GGZ71189.1 hypothetical protein GCM10007028_05490 [Algibacter mikhailovii]